jgi:glucan phosphoethanolaminetransferase (alkaline phosphatase superfamily)
MKFEQLAKKFPEILSKRTIIFGFVIVFGLFLILLDDYLLEWRQGRHFAWMILHEYRTSRSPIAYATLIITSLWFLSFLWASIQSFRLVKFFLWLFFTISIIVEYSYFQTFHRLMSPVDFWTAMLSPVTLWSEAIAMYVNWEAITISTIFSLVVLIFWNARGSRTLPLGVFAGLSILVLILPVFVPFDRQMGGSVYQMTRLFSNLHISDRFVANRDEIKEIVHPPPANNIVLVIDESLRGDHLSINGYSRSTTPFLNSLKENGFITNWGIAVAGATCSVYSNPHILTGVDSKEGSHRLVTQWPTVFQYARAMGYQTQYLDVQQEYLWNGLSTDDKKDLDVYWGASKFGNDIYADQRAAQYINKELIGATGKFIVINKRGMHILYENCYPKEKTEWSPTPPDRDYKRFPNLVINAYDNAVKFNLESFYSSLLPDGKPISHTFIIHTSDHGETLQENGEAWSHCNNTGPEASVPLFMIGELEFDTEPDFLASHDNILPTILDLMDFPEEARVINYSESLLNAKSNMNLQKYFLDGDLNSILYQRDS